LADDAIGEESIRLVIVTSRPNDLRNTSQFLNKRGWETTVLTDLKEALSVVATKKPDWMLVSVNANPTVDLEKYTSLVVQKFNTECIVFGENSESSTMKKLAQASCEIMYGRLSGPAIQMKIRKILKSRQEKDAPPETRQSSYQQGLANSNDSGMMRFSMDSTSREKVALSGNMRVSSGSNADNDDQRVKSSGGMHMFGDPNLANQGYDPDASTDNLSPSSSHQQNRTALSPNQIGSTNPRDSKGGYQAPDSQDSAHDSQARDSQAEEKVSKLEMATRFAAKKNDGLASPTTQLRNRQDSSASDNESNSAQSLGTTPDVRGSTQASGTGSSTNGSAESSGPQASESKTRPQRKQLSLAASLLDDAVAQALKQGARVESDPAKAVKLIQDVNSLSVMTLKGENLSGYVVVGSSLDPKQQIEFTAQFTEHIKKLIESPSAYKEKLFGSVDVFIQDFAVRAEENGEFYHRREVVPGEVVVTFHLENQVLPDVQNDKDPQKSSILITEIPQGIKLPVPMYLFLPENDKYLQLVKPQGLLSDKQRDRLIEREILRLLIDKTDIQKYESFYIGNKISGFYPSLIKTR
jgi:DNA-binding NarL/FixJ family response regulator